jgi:glycosyltransferase involved in cell wall biosynthesis
MKKLIIQIPCFNEEATLGLTLSQLPREVPGFDSVEWLVIDDGSEDGTVEVAKRHGVNHIVRLPHNQGLAKAFMAGLLASLKAGADVIINTDGDNQHDASAIPRLVEPILSGRAQLVIGARPISEIREFSWIKRLLQKIGSRVVELASGTRIPDAPSGFRAIHRDAAMRMCVFNPYTYTLETIIQAGRNNIPIVSVPVSVRAAARPSRLIKSTAQYVRRSIFTILRIFVLYKPLRFFLFVGTAFLLPGLLLGVRYIALYLAGEGPGRLQSLLLASTLIVTAVTIYAAGVISDLIAANRVLLEDVRMRLLRAEIDAASQGVSTEAAQSRSVREVVSPADR